MGCRRFVFPLRQKVRGFKLSSSLVVSAMRFTPIVLAAEAGRELR
jgi:hypothetical protein